MLNRFTFSFVVLLLCSFFSFGQAVNDFRTNNAATDWSNVAHWEMWNGAAWVAAVEYPGESAANANVVTVRDGHTASLTADVPNTVASVVVGEGASGILTSDHASNNRVLGIAGSLTGAANSQILLRGISMTVGTVSTIDGVLTDDNDAGVSTFTGLVTVGGTGAFTSTSVTTQANMVITAGINNAGTLALGGVTFGAGATVTSSAGFNIANGANGLGTLNLDVAGVVDFQGATTIATNLTSTANTSTTFSGGNTTISGTYEVPTGGTGTVSTTGTFTVSSTSSIVGAFIDNNNAAATTFTGLVTLSGSFTSTTVTTQANMIFTAGVTNTGTFSPGGATFGDGATLTSNASVNIANGANGLGTLNLDVAGVVDFQGATTIATNLTSTANTSTTFSGGNTTISGTYEVPTGGTGTVSTTGTFTVSSTSSIVGAFIDNNNAAATTFTGLVTLSGSFTSTTVTTQANMVFTAGVTNTGTFSPGGATFGGGATLTSNASVNIANGANGLGTLNIDASGQTIDFQGATTIATNLTSTANTSSTFSGGNSSITGSYDLPTGATGTVSTTGTFSAGASSFTGSFIDNNNTAATTFTGLVTVIGGGSFTTSTVTTTANLVLGAGIANAGTVTMPTATFTGTGPISGAGTYTIGGNLLVSGAVTVTNSVSDLTVGGTIDGNNAASTWINDANTTFRYEHATAPMATGVLTANNANSNFYYSLNGAQAIKDGAYMNLFFTVGGTKSLTTGNITVGGTWTLASGVTFDPDANDFAVTGATTLAGILADGAVAGTTQLNGAADISGGTIDGAATGVVNVAGAATLATADPTIGRGTITFSNAVTIPSGRTITFNANAPTGVKTFGTVTVDNGGTWTSTLLNTPSSLVVSTAFTNNGTATFGGADISGTLTSVNGLAFPNGLDAAAALTANITGTLTTAAASTFASDLTLGATTVYTMSGAVNNSIGGNLDVANGTDLIVSNTGTFDVTGTTQVDGDFSDTDNSAATTLGGLVTVGATGTFTTSSVTTTANLNLGAGIANTGTVTMPTATFTGTGPISGAGTYTIGGNLLVSGAVTVTNSVSDLTVGGTLDGTAGGSTWINDANTTFRYEHPTAPMATGVLTANNANSNFYYSLNGAQAIKDGAYMNLFFTAGGTKSLTTGNITVGGDWTLASGVTFDPDANDFTVTGSTTLAGTLADGAVAGTTQLNGAADISGGTVDGTATGVVNFAGATTLPTANPIIGRGTITFSNAVTIPSGRTITFNANSPTGVKTFGTVTVDNGGTWTSSLLTTQASLVIQTAFNNSGTTTFGGATFNDAATLTSNANVDFPNGVNGLGTLNLAVTGTVDFQAGTTIATNLASGPNTSTTFSAGNSSIGGTYNVESGRTGTVSTTGTFSAGASTFNGAFLDNNNTAATSFTGLVTIGGAGTFTSSVVTTLGNMNFAGGIANAGTFTSDDANFNGTQTLSGAGTFTIGGDIMVDGAVTVTNQVPTMTVAGVFNGNNAASTWLNDVNTNFHYQNATEPMQTGVLTTSALNSSFHYDLNGAQNVKDAPYYNLLMSTGGTKTLVNAAATVAGDWTLATGVTFNPVGFDFTVTGNSTLAGTHQDSNTGGTTALGAVDFSGGTIDGTATGVVTIASMTMPTVANTATIGRVTLTVAGAVTVANTTSLVFNASSVTGVKRFQGLVTVSNGGTWTAANITNKANLLLDGGFTNNFNATTFGGATVMNTLYTVTDLVFPNGLDGGAATPLIIDGTATVTGGTAGTGNDCLFNNNLTISTTASLTLVGNTGADHRVFGNLDVGAGTNLLLSNTGDFDVDGTTNLDGTLTRDNTTGGAQVVTFTGVMTVGAAGTLDVTAVTTNDRVYFAQGLTNNGTCNFGDRIRFGAGSILTANVLTDFPDGMNCLVGGSLTIEGAGGVTDHKVSNSTVFNGQLIIGATGSYDSRTRILQSDVYFEQGIEINNTGKDSAIVISRARFSVADQAITGAGNMYILDDVRVDNNRTVTNNCTGNIVVGVSTGRIDAQNAGSTWIQGPNSNLLYAGTVRPMDAGVLDASGVGNTVTYNTTAVTQDVKQSTYYNLVFSPTNNADAFGAMTVNNQLTLTSGTFQNDAFLTMSDGATISRGLGSLNAAPTFGANIDIIYTANLATGFEMPAAGGTSAAGVLRNLNLNTGGAEVTLDKNVSVKGNLTWDADALVNLGDFNFRYGTGTITGAGTSAYLKTNGTGTFIKEGANGADFQITYPVGNTYYSPCQVTAMTAGAGDVVMRVTNTALPYITANQNGISKYWEVSNTAGATGVSANFTFEDPNEVVGSVANYRPEVGDGAAHAVVTGPSANGTTPVFSMTGHGSFSGDFTYIDATVQVPKTFWSFQSGNWNDPFVWSTTSVGYTNTGTEYPGALASGDSAIVKNSHTITGNVSIRVGGLNILAGGIVDVGTQTGHVITNMNGQGTMKLNSLTLPTVTNNSGFVGTGGGTVEYYNVGGAGTNLPIDWLTYCNLTISNSTATDHLLILQNQTNPSTYTLNGNLSISATSTGTATLQLGHTATNIINLSIAGNLDLTNNALSTVGNFNAIHTVNLTGNITNNGSIDWCNTAQYQQFINVTSGAARLIATGASDKLYTCNGPTDVFQLQLFLGVDETYICDINPSVAANWRVFSVRPTGGGHGGSDTPGNYNFDHAYHIDKGTLKFSGASYIEVLSRQNEQFTIQEGDRVWLAGGTIDMSVPGISDGTIRPDGGEFRITDGTVTIGDDGFNIINGGIVRIDGGTATVERIFNGYSGFGDASFIMSGGTLNLQNVDGTGANYLPRFAFFDVVTNISISGGIINVYDPPSTANQGGGTIGMLSNAGSVTGGTWNFYLPASNVDMKVATGIPFYDVNVYKQGAGTSRLLLASISAQEERVEKSGVTIVNNLTIDGTNSPIFDANMETVSLGGNFNIVSGGTYQGATTTTFTGTNASTFTIGSTQSNTTDLVVNKTGAGSVTMAGAATFDCLENLTITSGTLDIGATIPLDVAGNITNAGTIQGAEQLRLQRGVLTANVTAAPFTIPTMTPTAGGGAGAVWNITIEDGRLIQAEASGGAGYSNNDRREFTVGGAGAGARVKCKVVGGAIQECWVQEEGSGYGPTVGISGGGGTGATAACILTGDAGAAATLAIDVVNPGEGYTSAATYTITGGGAATDLTLAPNVSGGTFANVSLNNYQGAAATSDLTLTGNLRLANGNFAMAEHTLNLGTASNIYDGLAGTGTTFDNTKMVTTAGLTSNGGIAKAYNGLCFLYPLGIGTDYMEENLCFSGAPTAYGTITVKPVTGEHPLVSATGQSLTAYWNISSSGTTLGAATVSHTMKYATPQVVDNGGTVVETQYVAGRYAPGATAWTADAAPFVTAATNTGTVSGATFNAAIDGDYTFGDQTPVDPFAAVTTYYSRSAGTFVFEDPNAWSIDGTLKHGGAASVTAPSAGDVVVIGDGVLTHTMTVGTNTQACAFITIAPLSTLDVATTTGHNFGTYTSAGASDGKLRISSAAATAEFPAGDWAAFNNTTGGTVEYYTSGAQSFTIPATSAAPTSAALTDYRNLLLTPATGDNITTADVNMTIHEDITVQGASATGLAYINTAAVRTIAVGQDFKVTSGNAQFRNGNAQAVTVTRNVEVSAGAILDVENLGATVHTIEITGDFVNDGTVNFNQASDVDLTFIGTGNTSIRGTTGGAATTINNLTLNKGTDQTAVLDVTVQGTFTPPTNGWLTLTNGTFRFSIAQTITLYDTDGANGTPVVNALYIPATTCLSVNNAAAIVRATSTVHGNTTNWNDVYLSGKIEIIDGAFYVGTGNLGNNRSNDIEYASVGTPEIDIQAGILYVQGQIRRDASLAAGNLTWNQTGGTVTIGGRNSSTAKGRFEVCNSGVFNMSAGTIIINRTGTTDASFADFYLNPASSTVTGGTIQFGVTGDGSHNNQLISIRSSVALNNITVDGNAGDTVAVRINVAPLTIDGTLTVSNDFSAFNCNGADLIFANNGVLVNNNTSALQGVGWSGFYPGVSTQNTTFQSTTAAQTVTGSGANMTNFGNLTINNTFGNVSLAAGGIAVHGNLTITTTLADGGQTINAKGNLINNGTHSGAGSITMNGTTQQDISGTGTYENIGMNNSAGAIASTDVILNGTFTLTDGVLDLNDKLLNVQSAGTFAAGAAYSATNMIITTGAQSDLGIRKNFAIGATDITYPVGVTGVYTPVRHNVTANTAIGTVTVKPINAVHPSVQDPAALALDYYWNISSTGMAGLSVDHYYTYDQSDVNGAGEANYRIGVFKGSNWDPVHGFPGSVNDGTNLMTLLAQNYFDGDWTAGESDGVTTFEFQALATFYSRQDGAWNDNNTWSTVSHVGPAVGVGVFPAGNPTIIATTHDVTITNNSRITPSLQINGTGSLDLAATFGHNFGTVTGTGKLRCSGTVGGTFFLPLGDYTAFIADGAGTWEYYGTNDGTLPALFEYNNLMFTGASTKSFALGDVVVNSDFTINSGVVSNTLNNVKLTIEGDWTNSTGASGFSPGTGTVEMTSATNRSILGTTEFYDLIVNNTGGGTGTVTVTGGKTIRNSLTMTSGLLDFGADTLTLGATTTISSPGFSATRMVQFDGAYVDGGVFMNCNTNPRNITLPIGSGGLYTPVNYNITANAAVGTINVRPVATIQPYTNDVANLELQYYWNVRSTGFSGLALTQTYTYDESDVQGNDANYSAGHFVDSLDWTPVNGHGTAFVNAATNVISIPSGSVVAGDYTAAESDGAVTFELGPADTYYSIADGNYGALATWSTDAVLQHTGAATTVLPRTHNAMVVGNGNLVTVEADNKIARSMDILVGSKLLVETTVGHNFRDINGAGEMRVRVVAGAPNTLTLPQGFFGDFVAAGGGTINYDNTVGTVALPDSLTYCGLKLTGGNKFTFPAIAGLTLNGGLTIDEVGTNLDNAATNIPIAVKGNWTNTQNFTGYLPGTEIVTFDGTAAQAVDGNHNFGSVTINNANGVTIDDSVRVATALDFTDGILALTNNYLYMLGGPGSITNYDPTQYVAVTERARLKIASVTGVTVFPIGTAGVNKYAPVTLNSTGTVSDMYIGIVDAVYPTGTPSAGAPAPNPISGYGGDPAAYTQNAVNKTWFIMADTAVGATTEVIDVTVAWHTDAELPGFDRNNSSLNRQYKRNVWGINAKGDWRQLANPNAALPIVPLVANYFTSKSTAGNALFGSFAVGTGATPLPVELLSFDAVRDEEVVDVTWTTGAEINNALFEVERSADGVTFEVIDTRPGAGNSSEVIDYSFVDKAPLMGVSYYRLKQTDFNLEFAYSAVRSVLFESDEVITKSDYSVSLYPNPAAPASPFSVEFKDVAINKEILVIVVDMSGREFYSKVILIENEEDKVIVVDPSRRLEPGIYVVTGSVDNKWFNKKLVIKD